MSKHTPGPFEVEDPMGSADGFWIVQSGLEAYEWSCIAIVCRDEDRSGKHFITKAEQKANADLFVAAPDMLEAINELRLELGHAEWGDGRGASELLQSIIDTWHPKLVALVDKAEGK